MSGRRIEDRLDALLAPLRDCRAELDELTQARVRARLEAAIADDVSPADTGKGRAVRIAGISVAVALGAAAVFAVIMTMSTTRPRPQAAIAPPGVGDAAGITSGRIGAGSAATASASATSSTAAPSTAAPSIAPADRTAPSLVPRGDAAMIISGSAAIDRSARSSAAPIAVARGQSAQVMIAGAAVTVYGPGRLSPTPDGAVVEGTGVVVDRTQGDRPWSMQYHGATIVAMHATFAIDLGSGPRVTVVRGEISLRCSSSAMTIRAGGSGICPVDEVAPRPPARPAVRSHPDRSSSDAKRPNNKDDKDDKHEKVDGYTRADTALLLRDVEGARRELLAVIAAAPDSLDAATALLDLARLAASRAETAKALEYLERLDRHPRGAALSAAAAHLRATLTPRP